jgi:hypothetical protein
MSGTADQRRASPAPAHAPAHAHWQLAARWGGWIHDIDRNRHQDSLLKRPNVCTAPATRAPTTLLTHHQLVGPRHDRAIKTVLPSGCRSVKAARGLARVSCTMIMISSVLNARRTSTTRGTGRPSKVLAVFFYHVFFFVLFLFSVSFLGFEKRRNS